MPLDDTSPQLDALLLGTVLEMELSDRDHQVASKRYSLIPDHLQRPTSPIRQYMENALVYPQGSRAIGATIVHGADDDRFDLDAVLEFRTPVGWTPRRVLDELHAAATWPNFAPPLTTRPPSRTRPGAGSGSTDRNYRANACATCTGSCSCSTRRRTPV